jgi:hypothetical protein
VRGSTSAASKNAREHRDDAENEQALAYSARKMIFKTTKSNQMLGEMDDNQAVRRAPGVQHLPNETSPTTLWLI